MDYCAGFLEKDAAKSSPAYYLALRIDVYGQYNGIWSRGTSSFFWGDATTKFTRVTSPISLLELFELVASTDSPWANELYKLSLVI